jgi:hypothetical protein
MRITDRFIYCLDPLFVGSHSHEPGDMVDVGSEAKARRMADVEPINCLWVRDAVSWATRHKELSDDPATEDFARELSWFFDSIHDHGRAYGGDWQIVSDSIDATQGGLCITQQPK